MDEQAVMPEPESPLRDPWIPRRDRSESGWSILETLVAMSILSVAISGIAMLIVASMTLVAVNRETSLALEAGRKKVEEMAKLLPFQDVFMAFNASTEDDAPGMEAPGDEFEVVGLVNREPDPTPVGNVIFPIQPGEPAALREDVVDPGLGMPRDLNGDLQIDALDHSGDYRVLPIAIRLRWVGAAGHRTATYRTLLTDR